MYDYSDSQCVFLIMRKTTCLKILVKLQHADRATLHIHTGHIDRHKQSIPVRPTAWPHPSREVSSSRAFCVGLLLFIYQQISRRFKYFCHSVREPLTETTHLG